MRSPLALLSSCLGLLSLLPAPAQDPAALLPPILQLGPEGAHNPEAAAALAALSKAPASEIPRILAAINQANEISANYLRSAIDTITQRALSSQTPLPSDPIRAFLRDPQNHPRARRLAYELLAKIAPAEAAALLPSFADDPSTELRYDAVALLIQSAHQRRDAQDKEGAIAAYQRALAPARNQTQIDAIAGELRALGAEVDLPRHFGFLTHWKVLGPFDNSELKGFAQPFPPETSLDLDLDSEYDGKNGKIRWQDLATGDDHGKVDLNPVLGELKEVTGYATTVFNSPVEGPAELRLGCKNGWKVWFNGQFLFGRDEYHRGARIDQYRLPVTLRKGPNTLLLKVCQNADVKDWTREWEFQIRVCDASGTALLATDRPPTPKPSPGAKPRSKSSAKTPPAPAPAPASK
jgi:hypothetical protein